MKLSRFLLPEKKKSYTIFFVVFGVLTALMAMGMLNLTVDNDITNLLPVNAETEYERDKVARLSKEFPSEQPMLLGVQNAFTLEHIETLWKMTKEISELPYVKGVMSPFNSTYFKKFNDSFTIQRMNPNYYPKTQEELDEFVANLTSNRYLVGSVISKDHKTAGIVIKMDFDATIGEPVDESKLYIKAAKFLFGKTFGPHKITRTDYYMQVESVMNKYQGCFDKMYIAGVPVYEAKTKIYLVKDMFILLVPAIFLMILTLYMNIRTKRGTILPLSVMLLSLAWTMGAIGWMRLSLTTMSILLPPLMLTIGSSYTLHYLSAYYADSQLYTDPEKLVLGTTKHIFQTIILASLTTAIGFASFVTATIEPIRVFGALAVMGVAITVIFTFIFLPKVLRFMPIPHDARVEKVKNDIFSKMLNKFANVVYPARYIFVIMYVIAVVLFVIFIPQLKVQTNAADFFKDSDDLRKGLIFLQENFDGTNSYNITIRSLDNKKDFFKTREGLEIAKKFQDYIDNNVEIGGYTMIGWNISPVKLVEDLNHVMTGEYGLPKDDAVIRRFLTYLKASGEDGIKGMINKNFSAITFTVRTKTNNPKEKNLMTEQELSQLYKKMTKDLDAIAKETGLVTAEAWGEILVMSNISHYMIKDQIMNICSTLVLVFLTTLLVFRSIYFSIMSLIPLSFGVMLNFAIMSIFRIPLDVSTVMISAVAIGVGIDDSIHFMLNYRHRLRDGIPVKDAVIQTLHKTSRPITFTSIALILGFAVFFMSSFKPIIYFGVLIAISMVTCTVATLFILPSMLIVMDRFRFKYRQNTITGVNPKKSTDNPK